MATPARFTFFVFIFSTLITQMVSAADFQAVQLVGIRDFIIMRGLINQGDDARFRDLVLSRLNQGRLIDSVRLFSPGGNVEAAVGIGKQIRLLGIATTSPFKQNGKNVCITGGAYSTDFETGAGCTCESACSLIWMAGVPRYGHVIGIHAPRYNEVFFGSLTADQAEEQYKTVINQIRDYLAPLDVPDFVQREMYSATRV
jgi:hypothetical protein